MADVFSKRKRSQIMSRIRSSGSKPELVLRALVRRASGGLSLRYNYVGLPGSPDVVICLVVIWRGLFLARMSGARARPEVQRQVLEGEARQEQAARPPESGAAPRARMDRVEGVGARPEARPSSRYGKEPPEALPPPGASLTRPIRPDRARPSMPLWAPAPPLRLTGSRTSASP